MYQQGTDVYGSVLLIMLVITLLAYGSFPLIFARVRRKTIKQRRYVVLCYCFNFLIMLAFIALNSSSTSTPTSGGPYILWTGVFSAIGIQQLKKRGIIIETNETGNAETTRNESNRIEQEKLTNSNVDSATIIRNDIDDIPQVRFCRHCGKELAPDAIFCPKCGTKVVEVPQKAE